MALKYKISKTAFGKLSEELQLEYKADGNAYVLDVTDLPELDEDTGKLKRANDRLKADLDEANDQLKTVTTELTTIKANQSEGEKDVTKLTATYDKRVKKVTEDADARVNAMRDKIKVKMIDAAVESMSNSISTAPKLMQGPIRERLTVEFDTDDNPTLKVLKDGKPSDMTTDKLAEEFRGNKDYQSVIKASQASGSGTTSKPLPLPASGGTQETEAKPLNLATASRSDLKAHIGAKMAAQNAT